MRSRPPKRKPKVIMSKEVITALNHIEQVKLNMAIDHIKTNTIEGLVILEFGDSSFDYKQYQVRFKINGQLINKTVRIDRMDINVNSSDGAIRLLAKAISEDITTELLKSATSFKS